LTELYISWDLRSVVDGELISPSLSSLPQADDVFLNLIRLLSQLHFWLMNVFQHSAQLMKHVARVAETALDYLPCPMPHAWAAAVCSDVIVGARTDAVQTTDA
jgi:hypothetical protein